MKTKRVVVLPGSYNPPTKAHLALLRAGIDALKAQKGLFVPAAYTYVWNKLKRMGIPNETMPDELRWKLLLSLAQADARLCVDDAEIAYTGRVSTRHTLDVVQEKYPDSEVYLLVGSDKLSAIPRWRAVKELMASHQLLVACRKGDEPWAQIDSHPFLSVNRDKFKIFQIGEEGSEVSSTRLRKLLRNGDPAAERLMTPETYALVKDADFVKGGRIDLFRGEYDFLSNFFPCPVTYEGITYQNAEAAFQAMKCVTPEERLPFTECDAAKAKRLGRRVQLRPDWEDVKVGLMGEIVRAKFEQNPWLAARLLATGTAKLIEGNTWGDTCWGYDTRTGQGANHLGEILMRVRDEMREMFGGT